MRRKKKRCNWPYPDHCLFYSYIVMTTSGGIMDHEEARRKHLGGKILGFFF